MISIITEEAPPPPEIKFPCLMESLMTGCVVLFTDATTGTVVNTTDGFNDPWAIGHYSADWQPVTIVSTWKLFTKTITLKND